MVLNIIAAKYVVNNFKMSICIVEHKRNKKLVPSMLI